MLQYLHFLNDREILRWVIQCPHPSCCMHPVHSKGGFLMKEVFYFIFFPCPLFPSALHVVIHLFCLPREEEEETHLVPQSLKLRNAIHEGQHLVP